MLCGMSNDSQYDDVVIWLIRHAESEGNVNRRTYAIKNNLTIPITNPVGINQARFGGAHFVPYLKDEFNIRSWSELKIYSSHCVRALQTLKENYNGASTILEGQPDFELDERLIEKFFGVTDRVIHSNKRFDFLRTKILKIIEELILDNYKVNPFHARNLMGDATAQSYKGKVDFVEQVLNPAIAQGNRRFLLMGHGNGHRCMIAVLAKAPIVQMDRIDEPCNGDIIEVRGRGRYCTVRKIFDGRSMKPANENLIAGVEYIAIDDVTSPPDPLPAKMQPLIKN